MSARLYKYVGPAAIYERAQSSPKSGVQILCAQDLETWARQSELAPDEQTTVTFVVAADGIMRIADRRSEHVACAAGQPVLAAGEISFAISRRGVEIMWITNQSTGYCPEPSCWPAVEFALRRAGIAPLEEFTQAFDYRRCANCQSIAIVKDRLLRCEVCRARLPEKWNLAAVG